MRMPSDLPGSRLPMLGPDGLDPAQLALRADITEGPRAADRSRSPITDEDGHLVGPFNAMLFNPHVGGPLQALGAAIRYRTGFDDHLREIAILIVAATLNSPFEWFAHEQLARAAGVSDQIIAAIAGNVEPTGLDSAERAIYRSTLALVSEGDLDDTQFAELQAEFGPRGCVELVALVGYYRMLALVLRTFRVPVPDSL